MKQNIININPEEEKILNIIKAQQGFSNKSLAISFVIKKYADSFLEPELNPKFIEKLRESRKEGYGKKYSSVEEMRKSLLD